MHVEAGDSLQEEEMMILTTNQLIGVCFLLFGSFLLGYARGREAERRSLRTYLLSNLLNEMKNIKYMNEHKEEGEAQEKQDMN